MNLSTEQKQTHRYGEQICGCQGGRKGSWMVWEFVVSSCKLIHLEWISNEVLLYSTGNYIQYPGIDHVEDNIRKGMCRVPIVAQQRIQLIPMRMWVRSPVSLSGLRIQRCHELRCRSAATAPIWSLAQELPYAVGVALKRQKEKKKKEREWVHMYVWVILLHSRNWHNIVNQL